MRVGILDEGTGSASFSHLQSINLHNHVEFKTVSSATTAAYNAELATLQGTLHDALWPDIASRPPWKIVVVTPQGDFFTPPCVDIMFSFHHALADGTGGKDFHEHLLAALNSPDAVGAATAEPTHVLSFPDAPILPESQDDIVGFKTSIPFMVRVLWDELGPRWLKPSVKSPWGGKDVSFSLPYLTRIIAVDFAPPILTALLAACRSQSTTLTGLFHALILTSLTRRISPEQAPFFTSQTPISLRPYLLPVADEALKNAMRVLISSFTHEHAAATLKQLRMAPTDDLVWQSAKHIKAELTTRASTLPADDRISLLKYVSDWPSFHRSKDGHPRESSWEVSNIGVVKNPSDQGWRITRAIFANGAMVTGSAIGFNVMSVQGEGLTVGISWQQDIVDEDVIRGVAGDLEQWSDRFLKTGKFLD